MAGEEEEVVVIGEASLTTEGGAPDGVEGRGGGGGGERVVLLGELTLLAVEAGEGEERWGEFMAAATEGEVLVGLG